MDILLTRMKISKSNRSFVRVVNQKFIDKSRIKKRPINQEGKTSSNKSKPTKVCLQ